MRTVIEMAKEAVKAEQPCPTCEALARTVMLDQTSHDAQRKPLTDEEIDALREKHSEGRGSGWRFDFKGFAEPSKPHTALRGKHD